MPTNNFVQKRLNLAAARALMLTGCVLFFGWASAALAQGQLTRLDSVVDAHVNSQPAFVVDFGRVEVGFLRTVGVGYSNVGAGPITNIMLGELQGDDPEVFLIVEDNCTGAELAPGENCTIFLRFEPPESGDYSADIILTSSAPESPELIRLIGIGIVDGIFGDRFEDAGQGIFVDS